MSAKMKKHPNVGSTLDEFLRSEGLLEEARAIAAKRVIAWQLQEQMKTAGISKTDMATRMETSRRQLDRVLNPNDGNVTLETLQRAARAVGRELRLELA